MSNHVCYGNPNGENHPCGCAIGRDHTGEAHQSVLHRSQNMLVAPAGVEWEGWPIEDRYVPNIGQLKDLWVERYSTDGKRYVPVSEREGAARGFESFLDSVRRKARQEGYEAALLLKVGSPN